MADSGMARSGPDLANSELFNFNANRLQTLNPDLRCIPRLPSPRQPPLAADVRALAPPALPRCDDRCCQGMAIRRRLSLPLARIPSLQV
jgi:hypothetical protein